MHGLAAQTRTPMSDDGEAFAGGPQMTGNRERSSKPAGRTTACLAAAFALALTAASAHHAAAAAITVNVERRGNTLDIQASALLQADAATAWRVLTDYDRYVEFIPDLRVSRVRARRGAAVTVEQSGDAVLWLLRMPLDITFEITEFAPSSLQSRAVAGNLRMLESRYVLTPAAPGVRLDYAGQVEPGFELLGPIEQLAVRHNIARQFQALAEEIERRSAAAMGHAAAGAH